MAKSIFIASTGQNVGKTTCCLGILSGLNKRFKRIGFIKPVGQKHVQTLCGKYVDKDVVLFKEQFQLKDPIREMSPVLIPKGFTRSYLDGEISTKALEQDIFKSYQDIADASDMVLVEGTGHVGVGSIVDLHNAKVAQLLDVPMILIVSGGLGSAFDAFCVNYSLCKQAGAKVIGVILNRVHEAKREMVLSYMQKALKRLNMPILGCIPYDAFLSNPSMKDFSSLLQSELFAGKSHLMRHFQHIKLIASTVEVYEKLIIPSQLVITPACRHDIIRATLKKHYEFQHRNPSEDLKAGMILTGSIPPTNELVEELKQADIPCLHTFINSYNVMKMISAYTCKIQREDTQKVLEAIEVVEKHIDFDQIIDLMQ